jgi:hypothetical protein
VKERKIASEASSSMPLPRPVIRNWNALPIEPLASLLAFAAVCELTPRSLRVLSSLLAALWSWELISPDCPEMPLRTSRASAPPAATISSRTIPAPAPRGTR